MGWYCVTWLTCHLRPGTWVRIEKTWSLSHEIQSEIGEDSGSGMAHNTSTSPANIVLHHTSLPVISCLKSDCSDDGIFVKLDNSFHFCSD